MADSSTPAQRFDSFQKTQILMHEYSGLRTEIVHRTNNAFQLITVGGAIVVWLLSRAAETIAEGTPIWRDWAFGVCIVLALGALGLGAKFIVWRVHNAKRRLAEIVRIVNDLAGETDLLHGRS